MTARDEAIFWLVGDSGCTEEQTAELIDNAIKEAIAYEQERIVLGLQAIHDGDQWQDGGNHPNTGITKCGACKPFLSIVKNEKENLK